RNTALFGNWRNIQITYVQYKNTESTISKIIPETCAATCRHLKGKYLKVPSSQDWRRIATEYEHKWDFPNCLGAIDGRHITFSPPISSGSYYFNNKGTNSIVLLGLVYANYRFIFVNIGVNGRISDGGVFDECGLYKRLRANTLNLPTPRVLPGRSTAMPYVFIGDDAIPL
ncbi:hypothetical protein PPYR_01130, partial [Photinus pyralis]